MSAQSCLSPKLPNQHSKPPNHLTWLLCSFVAFAVSLHIQHSSLIANITRCFFWLGDQFETPLLLQSILMILAQVSSSPCMTRSWKPIPQVFQLALLYICIRFKPYSGPGNHGLSTRLMSFWQWPTYIQYIEFLAGLMYVTFAPLTSQDVI
jgi:hypothetical protein